MTLDLNRLSARIAMRRRTARIRRDEARRRWALAERTDHMARDLGLW